MASASIDLWDGKRVLAHSRTHCSHLLCVGVSIPSKRHALHYGDPHLLLPRPPPLLLMMQARGRAAALCMLWWWCMYWASIIT